MSLRTDISSQLKRLDRGINGLPYLLGDDELIAEHIRLIDMTKHTMYVDKKYVSSFVDDRSGKSPLTFSGFKAFYTFIHTRWVHILKSCYDPDYHTYKYFGAKGIRVSPEVMDGKEFCKWCLSHYVVRRPFTYADYIVRRDKSKDYSFDNMVVYTEKQLHESKSLQLALMQLQLVSKYKEDHDDSVNYMTFYTRYFMHDFDIDDARFLPYTPRQTAASYGFKPDIFYNSVADENSCPKSVFISRIHDSYLVPGFKLYPYDMLTKENYSVCAEARKQGKQGYKEIWDRQAARKRKMNNQQSNDQQNNSVYSNVSSNEVYSNTSDEYS